VLLKIVYDDAELGWNRTRRAELSCEQEAIRLVDLARLEFFARCS
jgi:hypothetical protein